MAKCFQKYSYNINDFALNPTKTRTYEVLEAIIADLVKAAGATHIHIGA